LRVNQACPVGPSGSERTGIQRLTQCETALVVSGLRRRPPPLVFVLGNRAEDAFHLSMIGSGGNLKVFWSSGLVGSITTLAILLLFWPVIDGLLGRAGWTGRAKPASN